jgi:hypothetical protein
MYLNQFESTSEVRLNQILQTLEHVHGVKINIDLDKPTSDRVLKETQQSYEAIRDSIIKESAFNSYQQNPEYIKSMLILEAVRLMITEIAPKRSRRKRMQESNSTQNIKMNERVQVMKAQVNDQAKPGMDNVHEAGRDQDNDGDNDFADIMIARMMKSGMSRQDAIKKTRNKSYNKESMNESIGQTHHYEYQASMARSELYRNAKYATSMLNMVKADNEIQPWIAGALTKAANYLDKIFHYLDYYQHFEPEQLPEDMEAPMELGETSGSIARENLMLILEYSTKLFSIIKPGDKLEGWVAMKLTTASECVSSCKHYMDYVQFEQNGLDDHFDEGRRAGRKAVAESMIRESEDIEKAQAIIFTRDLTAKIQDMAEEVAKLAVEELMPLIDTLRDRFGPEVATGYNDAVKPSLEKLLDLTTQTKEQLATASETVESGGTPAAKTDIENAAPEGEESTGDEPTSEPTGDESDLDSAIADLGGKEKPSPDEPLGRSKKEEVSEGKKGKIPPEFLKNIEKNTKKKNAKKGKVSENVEESKMTCMECGVGMYENTGTGRMQCNECGHTMVIEANMYGKDGILPPSQQSPERLIQQAKSGNIGSAVQWAKNKIMPKKPTGPAAKPGELERLSTDRLKTMKGPEVAQELAKRAKEEKTAAKQPVKITQVQEKAVSKAQQMAAGAALAAKRTGSTAGLKGASKAMSKMSTKELEKFAGTKHNGLPNRKTKTDEAVKFINSKRSVFEERYGVDCIRQLYAAAWKTAYGVSADYTKAEKVIAECKVKISDLYSKLEEHKNEYSKMVNEGIVTDPLNLGYGLEGDSIMQNVRRFEKKITEAKSVMKLRMQEGIAAMLADITSVEKATTLSETASATPYGVIYKTASGRKSKKMFESIETRNYWIGLRGNSIQDVKMIEPETFERAINTALRG